VWSLAVPLAAFAQDIRVGAVIGTANVQPDRTLSPGDQVVSGDASRIDLYIDPSVRLRLYPNVEAHVSRTVDGFPRVDLIHGEILSGVVDLAPVRFEIGTPQVAVRPDMPGSVRVVVAPSTESEIDALTSDVEVFAQTGSRWLRMGQKMYVRGTAANPEFKIVDAIALAHPPAVVAVDVVRIVRVHDDSPRPIQLVRPAPGSTGATPPTSTAAPQTSGTPARPSFPGRGK
jgi:hypothetical protein